MNGTRDIKTLTVPYYSSRTIEISMHGLTGTFNSELNIFIIFKSEIIEKQNIHSTVADFFIINTVKT